VQPGDTLAVRIDDIALGAFAPYAVTMLIGDFASICGRPVVTDGIGPGTRICPLESDDVVFPTLGGDLRLPTRPMVGTIGTAPADRSWISLHSALGHGGNMDCPSLTVGSTVLLPVNVAGGLLSLGDVHASMGDAEVTGTALETIVCETHVVLARPVPIAVWMRVLLTALLGRTSLLDAPRVFRTVV
jgi:amidase